MNFAVSLYREYFSNVINLKCQEKIAKTLDGESYSSTGSRLYEINMSKALKRSVLTFFIL